MDWGPKPFRFINTWTSHHEFKEVLSNCWRSSQITRWGAFVIKAKLKLTEEVLK